MPGRRRIWRGWNSVACILLGAMLAQPHAAVAQYGSVIQPVPTRDFPFMLRLGAAEVWDTNVFRAPDFVANPGLSLGKAGRSDRYRVTTVGLKFEKFYALQRFEVDVSDTATRYDKFTSLDRDAFNYRGAWIWQLSPRISGTLSADHAESVIGFEDISLGQRRSTVTSENHVATFDALLFGGWHLLGGALQLDRKNSVAFQAVPDVHQTTGEIGLRYVARSGSSVAFVARTRRGVFPNGFVDATTAFIDTGFKESEFELNGSWVLSGKSLLTGRLTSVDYRYDHVSQRDFSGTAGEARYEWAPTGKLRIVLSALRNVMPWTPDTSTSYRVERTIAFAPNWQLSDKISMALIASRLESDYLGPVVPVAGPLRRDVLSSVQLTATWLPFRNLTLGASLRRDRRTSNDIVNTFDTNFGGVNALLTF